MGNVSGTISFDTGLVISEICLRAVDQSVRKLLGFAPEWEIEFKDGETVKGLPIEEVFSNERVTVKPISNMEVKGRTIDREVSLRFAFGAYAFYGTLSGPDEAYSIAKGEISRAILSARQWYWIFGPFNDGFYLLGGTTILFVGFMAASYFGLRWYSVPEPYTSSLMIPGSLLICTLVVCLKILMFPRIAFDFGYSLRKVSRAHAARNTVLVGIGLAFFVGMAVNLITSR